jgi:hypothetical protein
LSAPISGESLHPSVNILGAVDLAGVVDFCVGGECFFYETADLFFVRGVPFDGFDDQAVSGTSGLFGECAEPGA